MADAVPPSVPPVPQMRPLPQPKVAGAVAPGGATSTAASPEAEGATVDEESGASAVQLSIWQNPFVQNMLPLLTSLIVHAAILVVGYAGIKVVQAVAKKVQEQVVIPSAEMTDGPEGGIPHPGLGGDPNRDAAQDKFPDVKDDSKGIADKQSKDLTTTLMGGGAGESSDNVIGVGVSTGAMGRGKGTGSGAGDGTGSGSGDGSGELARFGTPGGGGGLGPKSSFGGTGSNARRIVYVLDATGSMMSEFDNLRMAVRASIDGLRAPQSFNVVFIKENSPPPPAPSLLFVTPENKRLVIEYVEKFAPSGQTDPIPALTKAFAMQPDLIYLLCDPSDFPDKKAVMDLIHKANPNAKIKINCIGFELHDQPSADFLSNVAKETGGMFKAITGKDLLESR